MPEKTDEYYMQKVLRLARKGEGRVSPNPLVGALIVNDGEIVGRGYHEYYGGPHAEVNALEDAGGKLKGGTLYVNLEPCSHQGKTPPCSLKVRRSGLERIVIAMEDPNPLVAGSGAESLRKAGIAVTTGVLEKRAKRLNEAFIKYITTDYPFVYLKTAQTLDGYLATKTGDSEWITGKTARLEGHRLRNRVDGILVGVCTVLADNPRLTTRLSEGEGQDALRIVLDSQLRTPPDAKIITGDTDSGTLLVCGRKAAEVKGEEFTSRENVSLLPLELNDSGQIPLEELLVELHERETGSILVEGGGRVNYSFLQAGLVDRIYVFLAPKLLGGNDGVSAFNGKGPELMEDVFQFSEMEFRQVGEDLMLTGRIEKSI
ncbi:MAG: bifunctional diaminohydroxyphosphoribosylaminopyrimidine deaminase/5-amino-6-(5-phosphoribosylamino)uracil reductase RibD [Halanaerobiaceae bacterium]